MQTPGGSAVLLGRAADLPALLFRSPRPHALEQKAWHCQTQGETAQTLAYHSELRF